MSCSLIPVLSTTNLTNNAPDNPKRTSLNLP